MSLHVVDTDTLSLYSRGHPRVTARLDARPLSEIAITVITVEEEVSGWYRLLRKVRLAEEQARVYQRLAESIPLLGRWRILPMTLASINRYEALKKLKLNVRKMDLRIAAIVLEQGSVLVTRNLRDFQRIPNLLVEDWSL